MQATCTQKYTVLDTVFTDWINRKVKTKNTWLLKYFKVLDCSTLFLLGGLSWLTKQVDPGDCGEGGGRVVVGVDVSAPVASTHLPTGLGPVSRKPR